MTRRRRSACVETVKTRLRPLMCPSTRPISAMCACHRSKLTIVDAFAQNRVHFFFFSCTLSAGHSCRIGCVTGRPHLPFTAPTSIHSQQLSVHRTHSKRFTASCSRSSPPPSCTDRFCGAKTTLTHTPIVLYALYSLRLCLRAQSNPLWRPVFRVVRHRHSDAQYRLHRSVRSPQHQLHRQKETAHVAGVLIGRTVSVGHSCRHSSATRFGYVRGNDDNEASTDTVIRTAQSRKMHH